MMRTQRTRSRRSVGAVTAAAVAALVLAAGCGDGGYGDGGGGYGDGGGATKTSPSASSRSPSASGTSGTSTGSAKDKAEIEKNWETFFDPSTPLNEKAGLLENGDKLQPLLQGFSGDPRVGKGTADVTAVHFTSSTSANVEYTLTLNSQPVLTDAVGKSVKQDSTWKVSVATLCSLVQIAPGATKAPGC